MLCVHWLVKAESLQFTGLIMTCSWALVCFAFFCDRGKEEKSLGKYLSAYQDLTSPYNNKLLFRPLRTSS